MFLRLGTLKKVLLRRESAAISTCIHAVSARSDVVLLTAARFVTPAIAKKYGFDLPAYEGLDQVVEVGPDGSKL